MATDVPRPSPRDADKLDEDVIESMMLDELADSDEDEDARTVLRRIHQETGIAMKVLKRIYRTSLGYDP